MNFEKLEQEFIQHNLSNEKFSMDRLKFCWELIKSDDDAYLETHFIFLTKANNDFAKDLQGQFRFRKNREKVFYFLQNKLELNNYPELAKNILQILKELNFKPLEQLENSLQEIKKNEIDDKMWEFVDSIKKSPYIQLHYDLMKNERDSDFGMLLKNNFDEHGENGMSFLFDKLVQNEDIDFHGEIIWLLGLSEKHNKTKTLQYARKFTESSDDYTRDRALIVLGLIGGVKEYPILKDKLLNDNNINCRVRSASAFMSIRKSKNFKLFVYTTFQEALKKETDYFVISSIINSIREIENNKFGISQTSLDNIEKEKVDEAKTRVKRYIIKKLK